VSVSFSAVVESTSLTSPGRIDMLSGKVMPATRDFGDDCIDVIYVYDATKNILVICNMIER
jgi:hypothetical protein